MIHIIPTTLALWLGVAIGAVWFAYIYTPDPKLDTCARENNVYACEYVPQPIRPALQPLPAPTEEK